MMYPHGEEAYEQILENAFHEDMNRFVMRAINSLPSEEYKTYFITLLGCNYDRTLTSEKLGMEYQEARKIYEKGLRYLRKFMNSRKREMDAIGIDDYLGMRSYRGGLRSFIRNIFTSSTEEAALRHLEFEEAQLHNLLNEEGEIKHYENRYRCT